MKKVLLLTVVLVAAIAWARAFPAVRAAQSDQLTHQPVGNVAVVPAVVVRGLGADGLTGVSSDVGGARHWSANIRGVPTSVDFGATVTVRGGVETGPVKLLSSMAIRELRLPSDPNGQGRFALSFTPKLRSPSYRLEIWNGTTKVFDVGGLKAGGGVLAGNDAICDLLGKENSIAAGICYLTWGTCSSIDDQGRFNWIIHRVAPVPFVVPAVSQDVVIGDQLRFIEETASSPGHVVFTNVVVQGTNLSEMFVMDEIATATMPDAHRPGAVR